MKGLFFPSVKIISYRKRSARSFVTAFFVDRIAHCQIPHPDQVLSPTPPIAIRSLRRLLDEKHMEVLSLTVAQQDGVVPVT